MVRFAAARTIASVEGKPFDEAYEGTHTRVDTRTADDPKNVRAHNGTDAWWYAEGENHRLVNGQITRDFPNTEAWFVDIGTLDELLAFIERHGRIVIEPDWSNASELRIEVYDDWRE